ncbi:uncharacterized protein ACO6RY_17894 [Pungitius sinensis]
MAAGHNRSITQLLRALISTITVTVRRAAQQPSPAAAFQGCRNKDKCKYDGLHFVTKCFYAAFYLSPLFIQTYMHV